MRLLQGLFRKIVHNGELIILGPDGRYYHAGRGTPSVTLHIVDPAVISRILLNPDLGIGEAYMDGAIVIEGGSIYDFLALCLSNIGVSSGHWVRSARALLGRFRRGIAQCNPVGVAQANVAHHYELSDQLYDLFLDRDRQYSCAYFASSDDTLERAQEQKKRHLAAKLLLSPGQRLLDIGSGWGGLGLYLAGIANIDVTGVTLSPSQQRYSQRRATEEGLGGRVRFLLRDYRHETCRYDRVVSVGMFEHVGIGHYREYFNKISGLLTDDGIALIHTIGRIDGPGATNAWIDKYIFPGGYCPALSEILPAIEKAGLHLTDVEVLRLHYAETLKAWRRRFNANRECIAVLYDERFCQMWEFYLAGCEASFRYGGLVNFQIQLSKRVDTVPLTRDYVVDSERSYGMGPPVASKCEPTGRGILAADTGDVRRPAIR
jgi:cyclopropane-fatty-acyl-phospholipid synthase